MYGYLHNIISHQAKPPQSQLQHMVGQLRGKYLAGVGRVRAESSLEMAELVKQIFLDGDCIASNWLYTFVADSSTDSLHMAVRKKYDTLDVLQKDGVNYLYLTLCKMFQISPEVDKAIHKFIELFEWTGVSKYVRENLLIVQEQVTGVYKRLDSVGALCSAHVMDVLIRLGI